jgi:membrane-associated phospholipid phosphatase
LAGVVSLGSSASADEPPAAAPAKDASGLVPGQSGGVPTPSPVVIGGKPVPIDRVAIPLAWTGSTFSTADWIISSTAGALTLGAAIVHPLPGHAIQGGILFDNAVRNAVRVSSIQTRYGFRDASNVELSISATWPFFVDALSTAWWYRGSRHAAQEMALLDLETLAIAGAAQGVTNVLVSRQRPYAQYCGSSLPSNDSDCSATVENRSFFSGHATFTFTSAALICINHTKYDLLGSPWDALSCAGGYAVAASTASLRVLGDVHWTSDVITGALVGSLIGYGVPLLHYRFRDVGAATVGGVKLQVYPSAGGAGVVGTF